MTGAAARGSRHRTGNPVAGDRSTGPEKPYCVPFACGARDCGDVWDEWRRLSADAPPFLQPEFFDLTRPIADPAGEPYLAVAVRAGRVAGVLPLTLQGRDLHPLRSDHSPRFDFWGDSGALSAIWEALRADPRWDRFVLGDIPAESPLATELPMLARRWGCFIKQIPGRLDRLGQREGLMFMPETARYAGTRDRILRQLSQVFEYDCWREPPHPIYILDGLHCTGGILGSHGPCDRACRLLWHTDWLELGT